MKQTIDQRLITLLAQKSLTTIEALKAVQKNNPCTKQGFYKSLKKLQEKEIIIVRKKLLALSFLWIKKQHEFYEKIIQKINQKNIFSSDFLQLDSNDSVTYNFNNANKTDAFWIHALGVLNEVTDKRETLCIYNPHEWFLLARPESEKRFFETVKKKGRKLVVLVDNNTLLDQSVRPEFDFVYNHYYISHQKIFKKGNYYVNVLGEYIIEVWLDTKTTTKINTFYQNIKNFNEDESKRLKDIILSRGKNKLKITKSKDVANSLKKVFIKYFLV